MLDQGCQIFATMLWPIHMEKVKASEGKSFAQLFTEWIEELHNVLSFGWRGAHL